MAINDTCTLTTLLPTTPHLLAYCLPLFFLSLLLTFAGAFLTLDRTRSFPSRYDAASAFDQPRKKFTWSLQGGIGGLAAGSAFGIHASTFLALLIPAVSSSAPLTPNSFIAVWLLCCIVTTFLAGRWKYFALAFSAISGGALLALSISVIIHPSLVTRIVLPVITTPILLILTLLPIPRIQHPSLRTSTASVGSFGLVLSIALLSHIPAWANVWERLWLSASLTWGTSQEKGLSAAYCLFLCSGILCDSVLKRKFGECPDQQWDHYLANFATNLPERAGTFQPLTSFWDRLFHPNAKPKPIGISKGIVFPADSDPKLTSDTLFDLPTYDRTISGTAPVAKAYEFQNSPGFLRKGRSHSQARFQARCRKPREVVKFRPFGDLEISSGSEEDCVDEFKKQLPSLSERPWLKQTPSTSSTDVTLITKPSSWKTRVGHERMGKLRSEAGEGHLDYEMEVERLMGVKGLREGEAQDYSDYEEDMTNVKMYNRNQHPPLHGEGWSPGFISRHRSVNSKSTTLSPVLQGTALNLNPKIPAPPPGAVPATPSLIKALDRIAVARKDAFSNRPIKSGLPPLNSEGEDGLPNMDDREGMDEYKGTRWDEFWKEVGEKARAQT